VYLFGKYEVSDDGFLPKFLGRQNNILKIYIFNIMTNSIKINT